MKYIVELNPACHIEWFEIEADTPEQAAALAKQQAEITITVGDLQLSYWELINVSVDESEDK